MFCNFCGKPIDDGSNICKSCGATIVISKQNNYTNENAKEAFNKNPILNSPQDINGDVIMGIINNSLESLTINYDICTRVLFEKFKKSDDFRGEFKKYLATSNPFYLANLTKPLKSINFKIILGENVESTIGMFAFLEELESAPLMDTKKIVDMSVMFFDDIKLTKVPLFNTERNTDMESMFANCQSLTTVPLFDTRNVVLMALTFLGCFNLKFVPAFNTENVVVFSGMFFDCRNLINIPKFNTENVLITEEMFVNCTKLKEVPFLLFPKITDEMYMKDMFKGCHRLTRRTRKQWKLFYPSVITSENEYFYLKIFFKKLLKFFIICFLMMFLTNIIIVYLILGNLNLDGVLLIHTSFVSLCFASICSFEKGREVYKNE